MYGFINKVLEVALCLITIVLMLTNVMASDQLQAGCFIVAEATNFVDEVTDTAILDKKHVADLYLARSTCGPLVGIQILRYTRVVNPDPKSLDDTYMIHAGSDGIYHWNQGDLLKMKIIEVGPTGPTSFPYSVFGSNIAPVGFTLTGRIRS